MKMKGYHLPDIQVETTKREINGVTLELPRLSPVHVAEISNRLIGAQKKLAEESIFKIIDWIDSAAQSWLNPNDSIRKEAESLLPILTGDSKEMIRVTLDDLFKNFTRPVLLQLIEEEVGDPAILDRFRPKLKGSGFTRAFGPRLIAHILPGNILGTSVMSLVCGLLAKSASLAKVGSEEIILPILFARSLEKVQAGLAQALAILTWDNAAIETTREAFRAADLVIAYGSDETIDAIRKVIPSHTRRIFHGHRISLGVVARESIVPDVVEAAAVDVSLYDQRGCLSPHLYYIEEGGPISPLEFARLLSQELYVVSYQLPKGLTSASEAAQIQQLRGAIPLKGGMVYPSPKGVDWTVLYDPDPVFSQSPLGRTVWIKPVSDLSDISRHLEPIRPFLQEVGIAVPHNRQSEIITPLAVIGVSRICPIGKMQKPPMTWHHDGRFRLLDILRFVDLENV